VIIGGLIGAAGIRNPKRVVRAGECSGGQLAGAPLDAAGYTAPNQPDLRAAASATYRERSRRGTTLRQIALDSRQPMEPALTASRGVARRMVSCLV
jgi:hypothetical protein